MDSTESERKEQNNPSSPNENQNLFKNVIHNTLHQIVSCGRIVFTSFKRLTLVRLGTLPIFFLCCIILFSTISNIVYVRGTDELKYVWGDFINDPDALGPNGKPYPWETANKIAGRSRIPRSLFTSEDEVNIDNDEVPLLTPEETRAALLRAFDPSFQGNIINDDFSSPQKQGRRGRSEFTTTTATTTSTISPPVSNIAGCVPGRLCETSYNTTAPMYGISLTSGNPVTIVQKFPDLLQQVVYQVCKSEECDVIQGECVQTYLPYLFLVIPLGPVTLTGQDYVLVESGCACRPKYAKREDNQPPLPFIVPFNNSAANNNKNIKNFTKPRNNKRF